MRSQALPVRSQRSPSRPWPQRRTTRPGTRSRRRLVTVHAVPWRSARMSSTVRTHPLGYRLRSRYRRWTSITASSPGGPTVHHKARSPRTASAAGRRHAWCCPKSATLPALIKAAPMDGGFTLVEKRELRVPVPGAQRAHHRDRLPGRGRARLRPDPAASTAEPPPPRTRCIRAANSFGPTSGRPGHRAAAGPGHDPSPHTPSRSCHRSAEGPRKPLIGCRASPTTRTCEFKSDQAGGSCLGTHIRIHVRHLHPFGAVTAPDPGRS